MTTEVDICNRAMSFVGVRATISNLRTDTSLAAVTCNLHYDSIRRQLLRTAPWGFSRNTIQLSSLGNLEAGTSPYPWQQKYAYPSDCVKFRYVLPPPPPGLISGTITPPTVGVVDFVIPWMGPNRAHRFLIANDPTVTPAQKVLLSNVPLALGVYNADITDPDQWDDLFQDAVVKRLAYYVCSPLTGKVELKREAKQECIDAVNLARAMDGNEAIASSDHIPDWIQTRGVGSPFGYSPIALTPFGLGSWLGEWENLNWGA